MKFKYIVLIAVLVRFLITFLFYNSKSHDLLSALYAGDLILKGESAYPFFYFPFFPYLGAFAVLVKTIIDPLIFLKIVFSFFDIAIIYLIYLLTKNKSPALLYALNPITIINTNIHGQFDTIPLFFLLLGIYYFQKKRLTASIFSLSFAIFTKTWPFLFLTPLFKKAKNKIIFICLLIFPLLFTLLHSYFFKISLSEIVAPIKNYRGVYGVWGISQLLNIFQPKIDPNLIQALRRIFLISFVAFSFYLKEVKPLKTILIIMLFFFTSTITFGAQWLTWLIPFVLIEKPRFWILFFIVATVYLLITFLRDVYPLNNQGILMDQYVMVLGLLAWLIIFMMLIYNLGLNEKSSAQ